MFRLKLLGGPCIVRADDVVVSGGTAQRHRLALLALLALAPEPGIRRDKLLAYLWPERDTQHGRSLLKQAVHVLRGTLGADAIRSAADGIRLDPDVIQVDVREFEAAVARGDHGTAVRLYGGPFLDGFFLSDAPAFEAWVERERERLADACGDGLEALAGAAEAEGDFHGAVASWKARAARDPYDSRVALRLIQALERSGNRGGALQYAETHARRLQEEIGVEPPPDVTALADRLRRKADPAGPDPAPAEVATGESARPSALLGHHAEPAPAPPTLVPVEASDLLGAPEHDATPLAAPRNASAARSGAVARLLGAVVFALIVGTVTFVLTRRDPAGPLEVPGAAPEPSIAVLPLANRSTDPTGLLVADAMTDHLITTLGQAAGLRVSASHSVFALRGRPLDVRAVADSLDVSHVLEGDVQKIGPRLRVGVRLVESRGGLTLWSETYERELKDLFAVQDDIARAVASELGLRLGRNRATERRRSPTQNIAAYEHYLQGSDPALLRSDSGALQRLEHLRRAVELDSTFAAAHAGLAKTYIRLTMGEPEHLSTRELQAQARASAERAVALDDSLAEGHLMLGLVRIHDREYGAAEEHFRRAIELDPSHGRAHEALAGLYLVTGRPAEGLAEAERALEIDPLAASAAAEVARALLFNGRCDEALSQLERIAAVQPPPLRAAPIAAQCYARERRWADAIDVLRPQAERDVVSRALSGYLHGRAGQREEALRIQAGLLERWRPRGEGAVHVAVSYAGLGDLDQAFAWLDRAVDDGSLTLYPWYGHIMEPVFQQLHRDPRFESLKVRLGLPKR